MYVSPKISFELNLIPALNACPFWPQFYSNILEKYLLVSKMWYSCSTVTTILELHALSVIRYDLIYGTTESYFFLIIY